MKRFLIFSLFLALAITLSAQDKKDDANPRLYSIVSQAIESMELEGAFDLVTESAFAARGVLAGTDIDNDGNYEVFVTDYTDGGKFHMFEVTGDNTVELVYTSPGIGSTNSTSVRCLQVADLDGNGDMEVILAVNGAAGTDDAVMGLMIYEYSSAADSFLVPFHSNFDAANVTGNRYLVEGFDVADVDGDDVTEVILSNNGLSTYDQGYIISFTGFFADQTAEAVIEFVHGKSSSEYPWNGSGMNATSADLDGDGNNEAVFGVWDHGALFVVEATAPDTYEARGYYQTDLNAADDVALDNIVAADLDDDGRDEVYTTLYSGGALRGLRITGEFDTATVANSVFTITENGGSGAYGIAIADLDDDGMKEIYTASYGSGNVIMHTYLGGDIADPANYEAATFGNHPTATGSFGLSAPNMDMDGDGHAEIFVSYMEGGTTVATAYERPPVVITEFPYYEGFEGGVVPPDGWTNPDGYWGPGSEAYEGEYAARVSYTHTGDAVLTSPEIVLPADHKITFYWKDDDISTKIDGHDTTYFEISTDGETWEELAFLAAASNMSAYEAVELDLSAYGNMSVWLRWRDVTDASFSAYGTGVDAITIEQISTVSVGWCNLQWPTTATIDQGGSVDVYAQVWLDGVTNITTGVGDPDMEAWIGVSSEDTDPATWDEWIVADFNGDVGNNDEYIASIGAELPAGTYYYASRFRYAGGPYSYGGTGGFWNNDNGVLTVNALVISDFPYTEGFEGGVIPPAGWTNEDGNWNRGTEAHSGSYAARVSYSHSGSAVLEMPAVQLPDANMIIRFWWKDDDISTTDEKIDPDKAEKISKYNELNGIEVANHDTTYFEISQDGTSWESFAILSSPSAMSSYEEMVVDLADFANSTVYFRWRDETDATFNAYGTGVDDVTIEEMMAVAPNPAVLTAPADSATGVVIVPTLDWANGGGDPTGYKVYFGDVNPPVDMVYDGDATDYTVAEALTYSTEYFWQVVPYNDNGEAADCPVWSFTTMDDPTITPPFVYDFEGGYPPMSWTRFVGLLEETSVLSTTTSGWIQDDFGNVTSPVNKSARNNIYGTSRKHWLVTPPIDLGDGTMTYQIDFELALTVYATTNPATLGEDDLFAVVISTDNGVTWSNTNVLQQWDQNSVISTTGQHVSISLEGYTGIVKIGLYGESTVSNADNDLFVDDFGVGEAQAGSEVMFDVVAGWNMVSVPLMTDDMTTTTIFANATSNAFAFDNGYTTAEMLTNGAGYWIKYDAEETVTVMGMVPEANIALNEGWNLIGPYNTDITTAEVVTEPTGIISSSFFGYAGNYSVAETMSPGMGYWVKASAAGEIVVAPVAAKKSPRQIETVNADWARLTITDATGKTSTLYIANEDVQGYDLPPVPPVGAYDVRYANGKYVSSLSSAQTVSLNSVVYPVTVRIDGADVKLSDMMGGSVLNANLKDGESVVVASEIGNLSVANLEIPSEFNLAQNYPNPFNPATTIKFSLPTESKVVLKVYNTLGEEVATILNTVKEAGYHEVSFNAINFTSGVYFYTIEAGEFTSVKKMILLK